MEKRVFGKYIALVSRRAAGVWTHIPSLTYAILSRSDNPATIVWIDFGLRYEMFNHFLINPIRFSKDHSLLGMVESRRKGEPIDPHALVKYSQVVSEQLSTDGGEGIYLSEIRGQYVLEYRQHVKRLSLEGRDAYLIPLQTPTLYFDENTFGLQVSEIEEILQEILSMLKPLYIFLTFEGQPEGGIFAKRLDNDMILKWALNISKTILTLVRFDTKERFEDSVAIPSLLSRKKLWRERLRLILTRVSVFPNVQLRVKDFVLGTLPFAGFIGESVNSGRIPIIDIWLSQLQGIIRKEQYEYLNAINSLSKHLVDLK